MHHIWYTICCVYVSMNSCKSQWPFPGHFWIYVCPPLLRLNVILYAGLELVLVTQILECFSNHYLF